MKENIVFCPHCGSSCNHVVGVTVLNGDDDHNILEKLSISTEKENMILKIEHPKNEKVISRMGYALGTIMAFSCETCAGSTFYRSYFQHKSTVFIHDTICILDLIRSKLF